MRPVCCARPHNRRLPPRIGLGGYCPVCILDANKWAKGSPEHQATYDGVTYYFPDEAIKQKFLADPAKYVPALGGDCIVCYAKLGKRVPGSVQHSVRHDNRLFLFPGAEQQQAFLSNPKEFADVDLALKGDCAVCLVHHNKRVAGKPEFAEIKDGFRYLFPSAAQAWDPEQARRAGYTHLLGVAKEHPLTTARMADRIRAEDPDFYARCQALAARQALPVAQSTRLQALTRQVQAQAQAGQETKSR